MSNPLDLKYPDMRGFTRSLSQHQRRFLFDWLDTRELQLQQALAESGKALSAIGALVSDAVSERGLR